MDGTIFKDDTQARRFELFVGDKVVGFVQYSVSGDTGTIMHTEDEHKGKGYGTGTHASET